MTINTATNSAFETTNKKQAVVVIHGMGEQRPMTTIRAFVNNIWKKDPKIKSPHFWNKPSSVSESLEQRKLTTNSPETEANNKVQRTDFYEYYWAHHTNNTKWEHFIGWLKTLLYCWPWRYKDHPNTLQPLWFILISLPVVIWLLGDYLIYGINYEVENIPIVVTSLAVVAEVGFLILLFNLSRFMLRYFGDVARYVRAEPANIQIRQAIRQGGIELLEKIHQSGEYDRIVLVGHSLGSIIAYDILNHLWARHNKFPHTDGEHTHTTPLSPHALELIHQLEKLAINCGTEDFDQNAYHSLQYELFCELREKDKNHNWLISDFITLGSPLTYTDILLYEDKLEFNKRKLDRESPTSPPVPEKEHWYYYINDSAYLHHGAVFSSVRWTNIFMPHYYMIYGDFISGPVSKNFSYQHTDLTNLIIDPPQNLFKSPIKEVCLDYTQVKNGFTHSEYWQHSEISNFHLIELRKALRLY
ncbi:hypothetical protein [Pseudoalteromonas piscicida]|nr:hypothetical protein [Pseudoalteromonas piscicida]